MNGRRGFGIIGGIVGLLLIVVGIALLISTGGFAYFGVAGLVNTTYLNYVIINFVGIIVIIVGLIVMVFA